jgi:hypothetical protein
VTRNEEMYLGMGTWFLYNLELPAKIQDYVTLLEARRWVSLAELTFS